MRWAPVGLDRVTELASSWAMRLPACCLDGRWEALNLPPGALLRFPANITIFFFFFCAGCVFERSLLFCPPTVPSALPLVSRQSCGCGG